MQVINDRAPSIIPLSFWTDYEPTPEGVMKEIERVEWTRKGTQNATTRETIERLSRHGLDNPIWAALKPYYDHWKAGKAAPVEGTPLAAWPGATPQLVKALESFHIRSVEDLANLTDGTMDKVQIPGIRGFRTNARAFVEAQKSTAPVAGKIAELETENENLKRELGELKDLVRSLAAEKGVDIVDEPKRGKKKVA